MSLQAMKFRDDQHGFTLIELLVVILIISILAAIALPAFLGQQKKGQDADAKSNARNLVSQLEACFVKTEDYQSCDGAGDLDPTGLNYVETATNPGEVSANSNAPRTYTVTAVSRNDGNRFFITEAATGVTTRTCSDPGDGGCRVTDAQGNMW